MVNEKHFIVIDSQLVEYIGPAEIDTLELPRVKTVNQGAFKKIKCKKLIVPNTIELIACGAFPDPYNKKNVFRCDEIIFEENSVLEYCEIPGCDFVVLPASLKRAEFLFNDTEACKAKFVYASGSTEVRNVKHLFTDTLCKEYEKSTFFKFPDNVYEGFGREGFALVDEKTKTGLEYITTDQGIIFTHINNKKAKFKEIPEEYNGKPVLGFMLNDQYVKEDSLTDIYYDIKKLNAYFDSYVSKHSGSNPIYYAKKPDNVVEKKVEETPEQKEEKERRRAKLDSIFSTLIIPFAIAIWWGLGIGLYKLYTMIAKKDFNFSKAWWIDLIVVGVLALFILIGVKISDHVQTRNKPTVPEKKKEDEYKLTQEYEKEYQELYDIANHNKTGIEKFAANLFVACWRYNYIRIQRKYEAKQASVHAGAMAYDRMVAEREATQRVAEQQSEILDELKKLNNKKSTSSKTEYKMYDDAGNYLGKIEKKK